jgi:hypothetical protein
MEWRLAAAATLIAVSPAMTALLHCVEDRVASLQEGSEYWVNASLSFIVICGADTYLMHQINLYGL